MRFASLFHSITALVLLAAITAAIQLSMVSVVSGETLERGKDFVCVVRDGEAGAYEAFPDVIRLNDGRLMVVFYAGYNHVSLPNEVWPRGGRISCVTSSDEGKTWSKPSVLFDGPNDDRDPSIARLPDGRLACNFFMYPSGDVHVVYSSDEGKTWSSEAQYIYERYGTSSPIRPLSTGRLLLPMYCSVMLSDDQGKSWRFVEITGAKGEDGKALSFSETDVYERKDGDLYAIHRTDGGMPMYYTISKDKGETWGETMPLSFKGHSPYLMKMSGGNWLLGYRGVLGKEEGWDTRVVYSTDEGKTWSDEQIVDNMVGAYPSMVELKDGSILIVYYEEGSGSSIRARRFQVNDNGIQWLKLRQ
jgi:Neuraminidase (sialidase)